MPKGSKKRNDSTSSSDESPPKASGGLKAKYRPGDSPEIRLTYQQPPELPSPSKLEEIARKHLKSRSSIIKNLTDEQASEIGLRIYRKWLKFRDRLQVKGAAPKKSRVEKEDESVEMDEAAASKGSCPVNQDELPDMVSLVSEEIEKLENSRFSTETERTAEKRKKEDEMMDEDEDEDMDRDAKIAQEAWEVYLFRKKAFKSHQVKESLAVTVRDSASLLDRLTVSMNNLEDKISLSDSPKHTPNKQRIFIHNLKQTQERLSSQSTSDESLKRDIPKSSKDKSEERPKYPSDDDSDGNNRSTYL